MKEATPLSTGHEATVYHAGSKQHYRAKLLRPMTEIEVAEESAAAFDETLVSPPAGKEKQ